MAMKLMPIRHFSDEVFEDYAFNRLSEEPKADFEEHLLICEECQSNLAKTDEYIRLMKAAAAGYIAGSSGVSPTPLRARPRDLRWNAAAAAILLLTCLSALLSWRTPPGDPHTIVLEAYRGEGASAPAGQPLALQFDLKDVRAAAGYRVEIVDVTGRRVWFGGTPASVTKGLIPGTYWVRLLTDSGELLREFGLKVS